MNCQRFFCKNGQISSFNEARVSIKMVNLETARAMLMYSAASEREASLVEKIRQLEPVMIISEGFHLK